MVRSRRDASAVRRFVVQQAPVRGKVKWLGLLAPPAQHSISPRIGFSSWLSSTEGS